MPLDKELKQAIVQMPSNEKDKLLLKLVQKDKTLVDRLYFELVEERTTLEERREAIRKAIQRYAAVPQYSAGLIMMDMRDLSGIISRHVKITKDTYGEVELFLYLLNQFYEHHAELLQKYSSKSDTCASYIAKKTELLLSKYRKLDEDYRIDFDDSLNTLIGRVHESCAAYYARELKLPKHL